MREDFLDVTGEIIRQFSSGETIGPPASNEYSPLKVGGEMTSPSPFTLVKS